MSDANLTLAEQHVLRVSRRGATAVTREGVGVQIDPATFQGLVDKGHLTRHRGRWGRA